MVCVFEFLIFIVVCMGEVIGVKWLEFDFDVKIWIVFGECMKVGCDYEVLLLLCVLVIVK